MVQLAFASKSTLLSSVLYTYLLSISIFSSAALNADVVNEHEIFVNSVPEGATVCKKVLRREDCYGKTPLSINVEFANTNSSKKFIVKKLGYNSKEIYIDSTSKKLSILLNKRKLFFNPSRHKTTLEKKLQHSVNERLDKLIYSTNNAAVPNYQFIGWIKCNQGNNLPNLEFTILLNSNSALKELKKAGRVRNKLKRYKATMKAFQKYGVFELADSFAEAISSLSLEAMIVNVLYSKAQTTLDFKQIQHVNQRYINSSYGSVGGSVYRTDTYEVYTTTQDVTELKDNEVSINYSFLFDINLIRKNKNQATFELLNDTYIRSNDTFKNKYQQIKLR